MQVRYGLGLRDGGIIIKRLNSTYIFHFITFHSEQFCPLRSFLGENLVSGFIRLDFGSI